MLYPPMDVSVVRLLQVIARSASFCPSNVVRDELSGLGNTRVVRFCAPARGESMNRTTWLHDRRSDAARLPLVRHERNKERPGLQIRSTGHSNGAGGASSAISYS